ncbi:hypothetical protein [Spirillospora sp. NPDC029432]
MGIENGNSRGGDGESRYWRTRTLLEFAKFGLWAAWEAVKGRF